MQVGSNGRCQSYERTRMTFEECCRSGAGGVQAGWSPHQNPNAGSLFYWHAMSGGAPLCRPCAGKNVMVLKCDSVTEVAYQDKKVNVAGLKADK